MSDNLPTYDFETATETERWAYDQGWQAGWDARLDPKILSSAEIREVLQAVIAGLDLRIEQARNADPTYTGKVIPPIVGLHDSEQQS